MESDPFTLGDQSNENNNCNLVGPGGLVVQIILIVLIFTAVKSTLTSLNSQTSLRETPAQIAVVLYGRSQTTVLEWNDPRGECGHQCEGWR